MIIIKYLKLSPVLVREDPSIHLEKDIVCMESWSRSDSHSSWRQQRECCFASHEFPFPSLTPTDSGTTSRAYRHQRREPWPSRLILATKGAKLSYFVKKNPIWNISDQNLLHLLIYFYSRHLDPRTNLSKYWIEWKQRWNNRLPVS